MNPLLTEEVKRMRRLAGIETNDYQFKDFLWALYEVNLNNCSQENILNEGIIDNVKTNFAKLSTKYKPKIKNTFNSIKKYADPTKVFQEFNQAIQGVDPKDLPTLLAIASTPKTSLKEAVKSVSKTSDLPGLKAGDIFVWDGETQEDFDNPQVFNFKQNKDFGLVQGYNYQVLQNPDDTVSFHQDKEVEDNKKRNGGYLTKLNAFYEKYPWVTKLIGAITALSFLTTGHAPLLSDKVDTSQVSQTGGAEYPYDDTSGGGEGGIASVDLGGEDSNLDNFKSQATKLGIPQADTDDLSTAATFKVGEYKLTDAQEKWAVEKGVKDVLKQIEDLSAKKGIGKTITINGKIVGNISSNPGDNDDIANDGSKNLKGLRANYGEKINKEIQKQVTKTVQDKLGKDVKVNFDVTKSTGDPDSQKQHSPSNYTADQSVYIDYDADSDGGTKAPLKLWNPLAAVTGRGAKDMGQRIDIKGGEKNGKETGKGEDERKPKGGGRVEIIPTGDADSEDAEKLFKDKQLNRNQEIFSVLKMANPNISGDPNDKSYKSWDDNTKKIVIDLRKSPDTLLKKFQTVTGIDLSPRQKSTGKFKRSGIAENILNEAAIDKKLEILGITDEAIRKNKVEVMAMLMKMYNLKSTDIPDFKTKLTPDEQKQVKSITGELDTMLKTYSDVERIKNDLNLSTQAQTALGRINSYDEFEALILGMAALVNPNFAKQKQDIKQALFSLSNKIKKMQEESDTPTDTEGVYKVIDSLKALKNHLQAINNRDEFEALIFSVLPFIDPKGTITKDKNRLANAIISASNRSSLKDPRPIDLDKLGR
jgi:hypothetical protein